MNKAYFADKERQAYTKRITFLKIIQKIRGKIQIG